MPDGRVLVISDGGTSSLLACAAAAERGITRRGQSIEGPVVWVAAPPGTDQASMRSAGLKQADLMGLAAIQGFGQKDAPTGEHGSSAEWVIQALVRAGLAAAQAGVASVVYPVSAGREIDLQRVSTTLDRALLVGRLVALEVGPEKAPELRTPYADFTDDQIADLILDMDLPIWTCWWWPGDTAAAAAERERWAGALQRVGWRGALPGPEVTVATRETRKAAP